MKIWIAAILLALALSSEANAHDGTWSYAPGNTPHEGFRIYRKRADEPVFTLFITFLPPTATSFSDPDRTPGNCYQLTAFNAFGDSGRIQACANAPDGSITVWVLK